jgi:hypothetical protein
MSFDSVNGYIPRTIEELLDSVRDGVNSEFLTSYTTDSFIGTAWYKYAYAMAQKWQAGEITTSEVFAKLKQYIQLTNERISRPASTYPGMADQFKEDGYLVRLKPPLLADAGTISVCVLLDSGADDYAADKTAVCALLAKYVAGGIVTQGSESQLVVISNGQSFTMKFYLPDKSPIKLRAITIESENNLLDVDADQVVRQKVFDNVNVRYSLGLDFEPDRYLNSVDLPWAGSIELQWSDDNGVTWHPEVFVASFRDLFTFDLEDISVLYAAP